MEPAGDGSSSFPRCPGLPVYPSPLPCRHLSSLLNHHASVFGLGEGGGGSVLGRGRPGSFFSSSSPRSLKREPGYAPFLVHVPALSLGEPPTPVQIPASSPRYGSSGYTHWPSAPPLSTLTHMGTLTPVLRLQDRRRGPNRGGGAGGQWPTKPLATALTSLRWAGPEGCPCRRLAQHPRAPSGPSAPPVKWGGIA